MSDRDLFWIGTGLWLATFACIVGGVPQHAWLFANWAGFALGYRYAIRKPTS